MRADLGVETIQKLVERFAAERTYQNFVDSDRGESIQIVRELSGRRQDTFDVSSGLGPFRREANVHAMTYPEAVKTAAAPLREFANPSDPLRNLIRIHPRTMPSITEFACSPSPALADPPNPVC